MCDKRNSFCYICGYFVDNRHRYKFESNKVAIEEYNKLFNTSYDGSSWYEPEYICLLCLTILKIGKSKNNEKHTSLPFSVPMTWHYQVYHKSDDCYFCQTNIVGHQYKTRKLIKYADVLTITKPVLLESSKTEKAEKEELPDYFDQKMNDLKISEDTDYVPPSSCSKEPHFVSNLDFIDLLRDLKLSGRQSEVLGSRLKQWNLVERDFKVTSCRNNDKNLFKEIFKTANDCSNLVYCSNIPELFSILNHDYIPEDWRLFIDGSCKSLKAVLLHNENKLPSVPLAYATDLKETYGTLAKILESINYAAHEWKIVSDLKVLTILLGMQGGYTKYPCYFCEWDSRAPNKYDRKEWPARKMFQLGKKNVLNIPLVQPENIILPPLHLKLGYMKQFVKALNSNSEAFLHLQKVFPKLSDAKIKAGVFVGPQIRKIMRDKEFADKLNDVERRAWDSFISLCINFLGNHRSDNYVDVVQEFLTAYAEMGCNMSIKVHYLHSHLDFFPDNLGQFSDEQGERFHQEIQHIEKRFQGKSSVNMISEYCWSLKRDTDDSLFKRSTKNKHF